MTRSRPALFLIALLTAAVLAGCGSGDDSDGEQVPAGETAAANCLPAALNTYKDGVLTIGTDSPAYPPYFEDDDPSSGRGFESSLGYAIANRLGFNDSQVEWVTVPFEAAFRPGPKNFDFDLNQIAITPEREKAVSFSVPYYRANQAVLVREDGDFARVRSLDDLGEATIGVQAGTTSLEAVQEQIRPENGPKTFEDSGEVVGALNQGQVDAIVVDLPTAIQLRDNELTGTVVAGQFEHEGGDRWGAVMTRDSDLKGCVDEAIGNLRSDGTLAELTRQWMANSADAPILD